MKPIAWRAVIKWKSMRRFSREEIAATETGFAAVGQTMLGNSANDTRRQENDGGHKRQRAAYSDSEEAEGKENKPNKRIQDQSSQRQRPAKHEQQAPEE